MRNPKDVKALSDLLNDNRRLELWRDVASAGYLAELMVIEKARATTAVKECWKHRLQVLKKDLGSEGAPMLEQLLIQHAALCWAEADSCRTGLLERSEGFDNVNAWFVSGETIDSRSEKIHSCM